MSPSPRLPLRTLVVSTVLALIAAAFTYVLLSDGDDDDEVETGGTIQLTPAEDVPDDPDQVTFTTFDDEVVPLSSLRGRPTVVNFFASFCVPCIEEMPAIEEVFQERGEELAFLGLAAMGDRPEDALDLIDRTGITYPTARDTDASVITVLGGTVLPTTVVLDADGEVVGRHSGELSADQLRELIDGSLAAGEGS